jgi:DNA-directed RNA polymerase sigma subunit (sigma70/sigma32)
MGYLKIILSIIPLFYIIQNCNSIVLIKKSNYLSFYQWKTIKSLIQNRGTTDCMKIKINNIIYNYYEDWAINKAFQFKKTHRYKLKHISAYELSIYSKKGLWDAIRNYNGKNSFTNYATFYINGELYKGLTQLYPITSIPKSERMVKKTFKGKEWFHYKRKLNTKFVGKEEWLIDININNKKENQLSMEVLDKYIEFWKKINNIDAFSKRVFEYKYDFLLEKQRTNKHISKLMVCSEEHIRKNLQNTLEKIVEDNKNEYNIL